MATFFSYCESLAEFPLVLVVDDVLAHPSFSLHNAGLANSAAIKGLFVVLVVVDAELLAMIL